MSNTENNTRRELLTASVSAFALTIARSQRKVKTVGYGKCADCSCPGFVGSSSTCSRSGCGHHYDRHW
jgi:hypothetical protein